MQRDRGYFNFTFFIKMLQGAIIGLGAVLPGISGGVLCVVFGIYRIIMELLADPIHTWKTHIPKLMPVFIGGALGFLGIANILSVMLNRYPSPSICLFVGLIAGMMPSLFREASEQGRDKNSYISMYVSMIVVFILLAGLEILSVQITPDFIWYMFCGFCLALSIIAPGMSFSTLLMPLGLYEVFISGIGHMNIAVIIPGGVGALITIILLSRAVNALFHNHYSVSFHAIIGIVVSATIMIIPFNSFTWSVSDCIINIICIITGVVASVFLDKFNQKYSEQ